MHAYQSFVWNRAVSERIRRWGNKVLIGDLVIDPEQSKIVEEMPNSDDLIIEGQDVEDIDLPEELDADAPEQKGNKDRKIEEHLIEVTQDNIHKYTINDVVMPIVGYKTRMPAHAELTKIIMDIMAEDKITPEIFERHMHLDSTSAWGSYRKLVAFASDIQYDVVEFQDMNMDLLTPRYLEESDPTPAIDRENQADKPIYKALRLKFSLRQSSYATMLLREVTRMSSAFNVQSAMSNAMNSGV